MNKIANPIEERALEWLIACDDPDAPREHFAALEAWMAADPQHEVAYIRVRYAWERFNRLRALRSPHEPVNPQLLRNFCAKRKSARTRSHSWLGIVAATAAVVLLIAVGLWRASPQVIWQHYSTRVGTISRVELADGSVVHLNTATALRVRITSSHREVILDRGEALFEVAHDRQRPFDVRAASTVVRAVGTAFSVRYDKQDHDLTRDSPSVEVFVREGRVAINPAAQTVERSPALPSSVATVSAGETITIRANRLDLRRVAPPDADRKLSWAEGHLWFDRATLAHAAEEFNRYSERKLMIDDPAVAELRIGGGFEATDVESFAAALERTFSLRVDRSDPRVLRLYDPRVEQAH